MAEDAVRLAAADHNLQYVDLEQVTVDFSVASVLPAAIARRHHVVPIGRRFGTPVVAMADPGDVVAVDTLRAVLGREFITVVARAEQIDQCLNRVYSGGPPVGGLLAADTAARGGVAILDAPPVEAPASPEQTPAPAVEAAAPAVVVPTPPAQSPPAEPPAQPPAPTPEHAPVQLSEEAELAEAVELATAHVLPVESPGLIIEEPASSKADDGPTASLTLPPFNPPGFGVDERWIGAPSDEDEAVTPESSEAVAIPTLADSEVVDEPGDGAGTRSTETEEQMVVAATDEALILDEGDVTVTAALPPLARVLVEGERVSLAAMREVLEERERSGQAITRILTTRGLVTEADLMWGMAQEMGLEFVDLDVRNVDLAAVYGLPESTARHHNVLLIGYSDNGTPVVAASNPTDVFAMDDLRTLLGRNFITVVATRSQITGYIDKAYNQGGDASEVAQSAATDFDEIDDDLATLQAVVDDAPIVRYVNLLILQALNERASDIHVEPTAENLRIRYRIDGVLHDISTAPRAIAAAVTTRLKVMADINIAEHRIPQDGRISLTVGSRQVDLRLATLPTIYGEKVVMRVLDKSNVVLGFEDLGFDADLLEVYRKVFTKPYGTILVTGPTGSGKTTTLYATLTALNAPDRNIITVEDPVELRIKGINQVQLNVKAGLTFASALRSILRADPDILLVGEIRDRETALISVEAALTGHLVLATLHTNDSASTPMRLVEMGLEPYLVTSALSAALAQRLARRLCVHCREPYEPTEAEIVASGWTPEEVFARPDSVVLHRAVGCSACSKTGYRGRKALLELLVVSEEIERLIIEGATADDIHNQAVEQGMVTLRESGLRKALEGETTLEEVLRVVA